MDSDDTKLVLVEVKTTEALAERLRRDIFPGIRPLLCGRH